MVSLDERTQLLQGRLKGPDRELDVGFTHGVDTQYMSRLALATPWRSIPKWRTRPSGPASSMAARAWRAFPTS
jgi:hypothetical protein